MLKRPYEALRAAVARAHGLLLGERAQTLAEYGLILTLVAVAVVVPAAVIFRDALAQAYNDAAPCLTGSC